MVDFFRVKEDIDIFLGDNADFAMPETAFDEKSAHAAINVLLPRILHVFSKKYTHSLFDPSAILAQNSSSSSPSDKDILSVEMQRESQKDVVTIFNMITLALEADGELSQAVAVHLNQALRDETNANVLERLGDLAEGLVKIHPDVALQLSETMASQWSSKPLHVHFGQAFSTVCHEANRSDLFVLSGLRRAFFGMMHPLGPGSHYFDVHLGKCGPEYEEWGNKAAALLDQQLASGGSQPGSPFEELAAEFRSKRTEVTQLSRTLPKL